MVPTTRLRLASFGPVIVVAAFHLPVAHFVDYNLYMQYIYIYRSLIKTYHQPKTRHGCRRVLGTIRRPSSRSHPCCLSLSWWHLRLSST